MIPCLKHLMVLIMQILTKLLNMVQEMYHKIVTVIVEVWMWYIDGINLI